VSSERPDEPTPAVDDAAADELDAAFAEAEAEAANDPRPRSTRRRVGVGGQMVGAAMLGLAEILQPKPKQEIPIEIANPGEPPDIDRKGLDEALGDTGDRIVGPPMDRIKSTGRDGRPAKRRR
jgi:hypothetical protein